MCRAVAAHNNISTSTFYTSCSTTSHSTPCFDGCSQLFPASIYCPLCSLSVICAVLPPPPPSHHPTIPPRRRLVQVVVSHHGLVGKRLKEVRFRHTYGAAVLGVHRSGQPMTGDIRDLPLRAGDVLVVEAGPEFLHNHRNNRAFSLISEVPNSSPMKRSKMWVALALTIAMVSTQV